MTQDEWLSHSEDWRSGWHAAENCDTIPDWDAKSDEWKAGYEWALKNPMRAYVPMRKKEGTK